MVTVVTRNGAFVVIGCQIITVPSERFEGACFYELVIETPTEGNRSIASTHSAPYGWSVPDWMNTMFQQITEALIEGKETLVFSSPADIATKIAASHMLVLQERR